MRLFRTSRSVAVASVWLSMALMPLIPALKTTPTTTTTTTTTVCADGWDFFPEAYSCYFIPKTTEKKDMKPWRAAKSFCEQLPVQGSGSGSGIGSGSVSGSGVPRLVDITSEEEQKFLERTITSYEFNDQDYWTGGHDFVTEGEWAWAGTNHTHFSANYTNWDVDQPVKHSGWNHQDCLFLGHQKRFQHRWHDNPCSYSCNYICEYSPPLVVVPLPSSAASSGASSSSFLTGGAVSAGDDDDERITPTTNFVARFRRGLGWRQETDKRTLVENIVISIENDVGGRDETDEGVERGSGSCAS